MRDENRTGNMLSSLESAVRFLAQDADTQIGAFPPFACAADELALEFDEGVRTAFTDDWLPCPGAGSAPPTPEQIAAIRELDEELARRSGPANVEFWTDEALRSSSGWSIIRELARRVVMLMEWSPAPPSGVPGIYVESVAGD